MLDIPKTYFDKGDMFWLAMSNDNRVIGMIGTSTVSASDMWLKRLFIMPSEKRKRLGSALLSVAEEYAISKGIKVLHTRFPDEWFEANQFYPANGFIDAERFDECRNMVKQI
jgi:GNAT superfamily N-acetyltransferase